MRVDAYIYDHDDAVCGGKDDIVDVSPNATTFLRLLVDTETGDWTLLDAEKHPTSLVPSYPEDRSNRGNIFDATEGAYRTLTFNGQRDGETAHNDEAEISVKIEVI
jgi:hypothetical protein